MGVACHNNYVQKKLINEYTNYKKYQTQAGDIISTVKKFKIVAEGYSYCAFGSTYDSYHSLIL